MNSYFGMGDRDFLEPDDSDGAHLSQDSQLSSVSNSLSQDLSQGSAGCADATPTDIPPASDRPEKKKKKKHKSDRSSKSRDKDRDSCDGATEGGHKSSTSRRSSKSKSDKSKSEKKSKRASSGRPEPEGGNSSLPDSHSALEYDRIINSSEPLFSDLETDLPEDEETKRPQRPRRAPRQTRGAPADAIFIPCTQLGINSNTMIKFAIIGTEVQNIFKVLRRVRMCSIHCHHPHAFCSVVF